ncbi:hypothetical protein [Micromonospora orduensis]|uniref:hypothetical protein n=1 Tax=Micromonospora orduensis TaxID=1420891 RepID=UPI0033E6BE5C
MSDAKGLTAEQLAAQLREQRALIDVQRTDHRERIRLDAEHREGLAEMAEQTESRKRARRERGRDEVEAVELSALYRRASRSGARARIRADIQRSAEMRALRIAMVRKATLLLGVPVLVAFGAWSTAGVQAGVVRLLALGQGSAGWWAAWAVEPALLTVVAAIIVGRAVLRSAGGDTDGRAALVEAVALGTSVALNMAGGWAGTGLDAFGGALAHSVGPIGAAATAWLIGLFDGYVTKADPWTGAPRLAELDLAGPPVAASWRAPQLGDAPAEVDQPEPVQSEPERVDPWTYAVPVHTAPAPVHVEPVHKPAERTAPSRKVDRSTRTATQKKPAPRVLKMVDQLWVDYPLDQPGPRRVEDVVNRYRWRKGDATEAVRIYRAERDAQSAPVHVPDSPADLDRVAV